MSVTLFALASISVEILLEKIEIKSCDGRVSWCLVSSLGRV